MIVGGYRRVRKSTAIAHAAIATDDEWIEKGAHRYGLNRIMTSRAHGSSTERAGEIAGLPDADLGVVIGGYEPLIEYTYLEQVIPSALPDANEPYVANLICRVSASPEVMDPSNIQGATDKTRRALFMSRSPIPFAKGRLAYAYYQHAGVLTYNRLAAQMFAVLPKGENERIEDINELRFIESGIPLWIIAVDEVKSVSVDTPNNPDKVRGIVAERGYVLKFEDTAPHPPWTNPRHRIRSGRWSTANVLCCLVAA